MKSQHILRMKSTLQLMDRSLEDCEIRIQGYGLQNKKVEQTFTEIKEMRQDIKEFLENIGVDEEKPDVYCNLKLLCAFFEGVDLLELEPKRLQEQYGKFDSLEEEVTLSSFVERQKTKIRRLRKLAEEIINERHRKI